MPSQSPDDRMLDAIRGLHVDPVDPADADELDELAALGATVRASDDSDLSDIDVPDDLWSDVATALDLTTEPTDGQPTLATVPVARFGRIAPWLAAAAVVALLAGATGWWIGQSETSTGTSLAAADLEALQDRGNARAELIDDDGELVLEVSLDGVSPGDGYLEVWLLDPDITQLVSLGPVRSDGRYPLPEGLDPSDLPVVDVSVEPFDGVPAHSGNSVFRGALDL